MLVRGAVGSIAVILLAGSAALAADASPGDASAPSEQPQAPAPPVVSASGASVSSAPLPILPALPADYFATTPHLLGEWPSIRSELSDLGIQVSLTAVDEAVLNLSGGERRIAQEAGQLALQTEFDLQKSLGLQGARVLVTLVDRWGRDAATDAGIPALQLLNEVYGRGNIVRLEQFAWDQKWLGGSVETTVGRLAFGDEFFTYPCDFINLTFCPGQAGNLVGNYIYNWPVSQWAAVARVNFGTEGYAKAGVFDSNPDYLSTKPNPALWPAFPDDSQGVILPAEVAWTPKFNGLAGSYQIGGWWNNSAAPNAATSIDGEPILVSGLPGVPGHGRYGFSTVLQQQLARDPANPDPKNNGLNVFLLASYADRRTSTTDYQIFGGIVQYGLGPSRPKDGYGIAVGTTHVNPNIANGQILANALGVGPGFVQRNEYVTEAWYGWQTTPWLNLKLDAQYVVCPGGYTNPSNRNAFVLALRTTVDFW
ncbi:MAG: carbohydrate porin [Hyphomicrobiales bacterium]|nr:carbohydrate porin [Hyphomicrobiales bacterium]